MIIIYLYLSRGYPLTTSAATCSRSVRMIERASFAFAIREQNKKTQNTSFCSKYPNTTTAQRMSRFL